MPSRAADVDLRDQLANAAIGLTSAENLFRGNIKDQAGVPDQAVFVLLSGGAESFAYQDGSGEELHEPEVTIRVRSVQDDYDGGLKLARCVLDALQHLPPVGYVEVQAQSSEPIFIEEDDKGRHHWSIVFDVTWDEEP